MKEVWITHPKYKEVEVSSIGRVRTIDRVHNTVRGPVNYKGRVISISNQYTNKSKSMYQKCSLHVPSVSGSKHKWVHRLVAEAFVPNPYRYKYVDHKDGNGLNNRYSNLEWVNNSINVKRSIARGNHANVIYINGKSMRQISIELGDRYGQMVSRRVSKGWCIYCATSIYNTGIGGDRSKLLCSHTKMVRTNRA